MSLWVCNGCRIGLLSYIRSTSPITIISQSLFELKYLAIEIGDPALKV